MDDDDMWKIIDKIDNRKVRKNKQIKLTES